MVDRRREQAVDDAAVRFADSLAESYRIVHEQSAEAHIRCQSTFRPSLAHSCARTFATFSTELFAP